MGLIKLPFTSITSTLHDQWEDYIMCDNLDNNTLVVKKTTKNGSVSNKSRIQVDKDQIALIFDSERVLDATAEAGIYTFDSLSSPTLLDGQFGGSFKKMWEDCKYDGVPSREQAVFFLNTNEIIENKFGSSSPILYPDPKYNNVYLRYYGTYSFKITNPFAFISNIAGNVNDKYTKEDLIEQINSEFVRAFDASLQACANEGIEFSNLPNEASLITKHMNDELQNTWKKLRGIEVVNVVIEKITPDGESKLRIEKFDNRSTSVESEEVDRKVNILTETTKENTSNSLNDIVKEEVVNNFTETPITNHFEYEKIDEKIKETPLNKVICPRCGSEESGKFCSKCGMKLDELENDDRFCPNCGAKVTGKFCVECGTKVQN